MKIKLQRQNAELWILLICALVLNACASNVASQKTMGETSAAPTPPSAQKEDRDYVYHLFYGTTRKLSPYQYPHWAAYNNERDTIIHYGVAGIHIPEHHQRGSTGTLLGTIFRYDPYLKIVSKDEYLNSEEFFSDVKKQLLDSPSNQKYVLIFIHGYNNKFDETLVRAAQLGADLGVEDYHTFTFSWASRGELLDYPVDEATIDANEKYLEEFLSSIVSKIPDGYKINIIAHSMGNRALLRVVNEAIQQSAFKKKSFNQIILAAPDVDMDVFKQLAEAYEDIAVKTTIYASPSDGAVHLSKELHYYPRVGYLDSQTEPVNVKGIDSVYVKSQCVDLLGHGYFSAAAPLLDDMQELITNGIPSRKKEKGWVKAKHYWLLDSPAGCDK